MGDKKNVSGTTGSIPADNQINIENGSVSNRTVVKAIVVNLGFDCNERGYVRRQNFGLDKSFFTDWEDCNKAYNEKHNVIAFVGGETKQPFAIVSEDPNYEYLPGLRYSWELRKLNEYTYDELAEMIYTNNTIQFIGMPGSLLYLDTTQCTPGKYELTFKITSLDSLFPVRMIVYNLFGRKVIDRITREITYKRKVYIAGIVDGSAQGETRIKMSERKVSHKVSGEPRRIVVILISKQLMGLT